MRVAGIMQPTYLPWMGYFELMDQSDVFVLLDDVQFNRKSWQQRNRIKGPNGEVLLTVPVITSGRDRQRIDQVEVDARQPWAEKHRRSIELAYGRCPHFDRYFPAFESLYAREWRRLLDLNRAFITALRDLLGIPTPLTLSSDLGTTGQGNAHIVEICKAVGCERLYDASGAQEFIDIGAMSRAGIEVVFQEYRHPTYAQAHGAFLSHMAALDVLFNEGPNALAIIRSGRTQLLH